MGQAHTEGPTAEMVGPSGVPADRPSSYRRLSRLLAADSDLLVSAPPLRGGVSL